MNGLTLLRELSGRYGSAWMAIQHLRVLNALTGPEVAKAIFRVSVSQGSANNISRRSLVDMRWYDDCLEEGLPYGECTSTDLVEFLRSRALDASAGKLAAILGRDDVVRWCPECLRVGYHAVWFQLGALKDCPLHGVPLEESCNYCHAPNAPCALTSRDVGVFECSHCGRMRAPSHPQHWKREPGFAAEEAQAFESLARWFRRHRLAPLEWTALNRDLSLRGNDEGLTRRYAARTRAVLSIFPNRHVRALCGAEPALKATAFDEDAETATCTLHHAAVQEARELIDRLVQSHMGCHAHASRMWLGGARILMPCVPWNEVCCVRLAYGIWKGRYTQRLRARSIDELLPHHAYAGLPLRALVRVMASDFFETVAILSDHRARAAVPAERLMAALSLSITPDLAGAILPPTEDGNRWWVVTARSPALPKAACSQLSSISQTSKVSRRRASGSTPLVAKLPRVKQGHARVVDPI